MSKTKSQFLLDAARMIPRPIRQFVLETPLKEFVRPLYRSAMDTQSMQVMHLEEPLKGHKMYLNPRWDLRYVYGVYEPLLTKTITQVVQPGWVCLDVGANAGYMALLMAKCCGTGGHVIAFEPLPANYEILKRNVELNHLEHWISCEQLALSNTNGEQQFTFREDTLCGTGSLVNELPHGSQFVSVIDVKTVRGDEYLRRIPVERPINFIKVDVEGAEGFVIDGLHATLHRDRPQVLLETHAVTGSTSEVALSVLRNLGYTLKQIDQSHFLAL